MLSIAYLLLNIYIINGSEVLLVLQIIGFLYNLLPEHLTMGDV